MKRILQNRKTLYFVLSIVIFFVITISVVYAALNTVLRITGNAEVVASNWDIYLDNIQVKNGSVSASEPVITNKSTLTFDVDLNKPGDYYEFTVDVVNDGSIDAMIDSVVKSPNLTEQQAKYLLYEVSYANGENVSTKQILKKKTSTPINVRVVYRRDLEASDLPSTTDTLNLNISFIYVQSDNSGSVIPNNGVSVVNVVSGNGTQVGDEICIGNECFYVISSNDETVTLFSKYNLLVGNKYDDTNGAVALTNPTGIQDATAKAYFDGYSVDNPIIGSKPFSSTNYWLDIVDSYPVYVYSSNSYLYEYIENYKNYLEGLGMIINEARLISIEELESLGCSQISHSCAGVPSWVRSTTYWTGDAYSWNSIWIVTCNGNFYNHNFVRSIDGIRPIITIPRSSL